MAYFEPPPPAPQRGDRATFSPRTDTFLSWLVRFVPQLSTFIANLNARDAGGANTFVYTFDSTIEDSDPGAGKLRLSSTTQNTANSVRLDSVTDSGVDINSFLATLGSGTSNVKGSVRLQKVKDPNAWILLDILSVSGTGGYRNLSSMVRASTSANPFSNGDQLSVFIDRNGDKGDGGGTPTSQQIRDAVGIMPISSGGTGASTSAAALTSLGALPTSGGWMSGGLGLEQFIPITFRDKQGVARPGLLMDDGNTVNLVVAGGTTIRIQNQARNADLWFIDNNGNVTQVGSQVQRVRGNNGTFRVAHHVQQSDGIVRYQWAIDSDESPVLATYSTSGAFNGSIKFASGGVNASGDISGASVRQTSDETLKADWHELPEDFLQQFANIEKSGLFKWIESGNIDGGIGAQSLQKIAPWAVQDIGGILHVNYGAITSVVSLLNTRKLLKIEKALKASGIEI